MKYIGVIALLLAMNWTWSLANQRVSVSEQVHVGIQEDLKRIISEYVQDNLPTSKNLKFEKFWSEALSDSKVKATFVYSFEDATEQVGEARVQIEGFAILNRGENAKDAKTGNAIEWTLDEIHVVNNQVEYKEPLNVEPKRENSSDDQQKPHQQDEN